MKLMKILCSIALIAIVSTSCVSTKKYRALEQEQVLLRQKLNEAKLANEKTLKAAVDEKADFVEQIRVIEAAKSGLEMEVATLKKEKEDLEIRINTLIYDQENQSSTMAAEFKRLNEELTAKEQELMSKQGAVEIAQSELEIAQKALAAKEKLNAELATSLQEREKRVNELEAAIQAQESKSKALKDRLAKALLGFNESDLTVEQRNGKVYISLSQELLFASGSATINTNGKAALAKLAEVMIKNPDIDITIEGHTDNVPFRGRGDIKDNWDLSVLRSTAIVRELIKNGVAPKQILASGRGEHFPIAENSTKEGRAKNRRSEIILSPKLDELYDIIKQ